LGTHFCEVGLVPRRAIRQLGSGPPLDWKRRKQALY